MRVRCGDMAGDTLQGKVAGVAFSKVSGADNVGYIIPWKIVAHFLREYERHGLFRGCCSVGFRWQDMENTHMRAHYRARCPTPTPAPFIEMPCLPACNCVEADSSLQRLFHSPRPLLLDWPPCGVALGVRQQPHVADLHGCCPRF